MNYGRVIEGKQNNCNLHINDYYRDIERRAQHRHASVIRVLTYVAVFATVLATIVTVISALN